MNAGEVTEVFEARITASRRVISPRSKRIEIMRALVGKPVKYDAIVTPRFFKILNSIKSPDMKKSGNKTGNVAIKTLLTAIFMFEKRKFGINFYDIHIDKLI
jgi:hypothetical protein